MLMTLVLAWLSSRSENIDPWLLYAGTVMIDIAVLEAVFQLTT